MKRFQFAAALLGVAALAMTAAAQTPAVTLTSVVRVTVKPDRIGEWLDVEKQYAAAYKKGGGTFRYIYRNNAGNPYEYLVVSNLDKYENLDGQSPYAKGTTPAELARMASRRAQCTTSVRTSYERSVPEAGIPVPPNTPRKIIRVTRVNVRNGMAAQYLAIMKDEYAPALKKAGVTSLLVRRVEWGGSRNQFTVTSRLNSFAELDAGNLLVKALGADGAAKLAAKLAQTIASSEYMLYSYVPDISVAAQ